jgi:hypothetical protein
MVVICPSGLCRRFFFVKGIEPLRHARHFNSRPFTAARGRNAGIVQALCNGPQTGFLSRL